MDLTGLHHLTAVSADARGNHAFYTRVLGMKLVKRTVNQDDVSAYHLFYGDGMASPGSDITFFEWPVGREQRGTNSVTRTALRVGSAASLEWWAKHLAQHGRTHGGVRERAGRATLEFEDPEGQRLALVDDGGVGAAHPVAESPVPPEHQIRGLGPVTLTVADARRTDLVLTRILGMRPARHHKDGNRDVLVYQMGEGGAHAEVHVTERSDLPVARQGAGAVHHVAFRMPDADYEAWTERLKQIGVPSSGPVDRYYFRSLYFREPNGILFELATDGPGFDVDEPMADLGRRLALPPFLEGRRTAIEAGLKPID
ncbi:ring-cleaving dioxygenase [Alsobacter sp. R-9]